MGDLDEDTALHLADFLPHKLSLLSDRLDADLHALYERDTGLSPWQWRVLVALQELGTTTATELGPHASLDKVVTSRAVSGLKKDGLIKAQQDPDDRRRTFLSLSPKGRNILRRYLPRIVGREEEISSVLSEKERAELNRLLDLLSSALGENR